MSLTDELEELAGSKLCTVCEWCSSRTADEQANINAQITAINEAPTRYGRYMALYKICNRHGLQIDMQAFRHHCRSHVTS